METSALALEQTVLEGHNVDQTATDPTSSKLANLSWSNLGVTVKGVKGVEKQVLKGVSGYLQPRQMLAIMGPSGSGKTTLLDALAGRLPASATLNGDIRVNGHKTRLSYGGAAYVTQDDVLIGTLSVRETLTFVALLRLPGEMQHHAKLAVVDSIISDLGLADAVDTPVGNWHLRGISGGQRRRLVIGCELVTSPTLLFLDEPTSGLDAASAFYVMSTVQALCKKGRSVVSVIHQPAAEVFALFDHLCLLTDGNIAYFGPATETATLFAQAGCSVPPMRNPADHFLHCINRDFADSQDIDAQINRIVSVYSQSAAAAHVAATIQQLQTHDTLPYDAGLQPPGWAFQTAVLTHRSFLDMLRDVGVFWLRAGMYIALCLCVGFIFFQLDQSWPSVYSRASLLFFVVAFLTFMSIAAFPAFIEDMKVFIRERLNGYYGVSSFVVANTLSSSPFIFVIAVLSTIAVYFLASLDHNGDRLVYFILDLFVSLTLVESIMMAIAPLVPHYLMGIAAGAGIMGIYMLCCGFFQPLAQLPKPVFVYPLHYMAYHTYSFTGFMNNEFQGTSGWACPCSIQPGGCPDPNCRLNGAEVLTTWSIPHRSKWIDLAILLAIDRTPTAAFSMSRSSSRKRHGADRRKYTAAALRTLQ